MAIILMLFGITIIIFSLYSLVKENYKHDENNFKSLLKDTENNIDDTQVLIGEMRREFAETILELQKEIISLKEENFEVPQRDEDEDANFTEKIDDSIAVEEETNSFNNIKIDDIEKLLKEGCSIEEISERLEISKGEILLIKDLYLK